ncbi:MAG: twin-arginine translocase subunit TatC [Firmicutes bacterium]|nr:twin-arginine translocase subunit TatC [Bacillota bacterium]
MEDYGQMTLVGHLTELRRRLIIALLAIIGFSIIGYVFSEQIIKVLTVPIGELIFLSPTEAFYTHIRVAIYAGFILALPVVIHQVWRFVLPALNQNERRLLYLLVPLSVLLFFLGLAFSFFIVIPFGMRFFLGFSGPGLRPMLTLDYYISFVITITIPFGILFQLPLVQGFLIRFRLVTVKQLERMRKYVVVGAFVVGALFTPPDVLSQVFLAVPLILLFELGLIMGRIISPRSKSK